MYKKDINIAIFGLGTVGRSSKINHKGKKGANSLNLN